MFWGENNPLRFISKAQVINGWCGLRQQCGKNNNDVLEKASLVWNYDEQTYTSDIFGQRA